MQNRNLILSIAIHVVMALAFVIVSPISAKLRAIPEIIVVKTYEMAVVPEPEPEEVVPEKPKPAPVPQEKPVPKERPRAIPDNRTEVILPHEKLRERTVDTKSKREDQSEKGEQRALPAVGSATTPTHEEVGQRDAVNEEPQHSRITDENESPGRVSARIDPNGGAALAAFRAKTSGTNDLAGHRGSAKEGVRQTAMPEQIGTASERYTSNEVGEQRTMSESGLSRVKLDPYHYQMVNICLRQCVRTMFAHTGMDESEIAGSKGWLKVTRGNDNYFEFSSGGRWVRFFVNASLLGEISNIDFVRVSGSSADLESLYEDATRKLCHLLGYDDCFAKL